MCIFMLLFYVHVYAILFYVHLDVTVLCASLCYCFMCIFMLLFLHFYFTLVLFFAFLHSFCLCSELLFFLSLLNTKSFQIFIKFCLEATFAECGSAEMQTARRDAKQLYCALYMYVEFLSKCTDVLWSIV